MGGGGHKDALLLLSLSRDPTISRPWRTWQQQALLLCHHEKWNEFGAMSVDRAPYLGFQHCQHPQAQLMKQDQQQQEEKEAVVTTAATAKANKATTATTTVTATANDSNKYKTWYPVFLFDLSIGVCSSKGHESIKWRDDLIFAYNTIEDCCREWYIDYDGC